MDRSDNKSEIPNAEWPDDAPNPNESSIMTVICGNTHLHWAIHSGKKDNFSPILFWRTPPLHNDERHDDPCAVLARHLPKQGHALFFGDENAAAAKSVASQVSSRRDVPAISVFVISTNPEHESALRFIFQDVAARLIKLRNTDFYSKEEGLYDTMGVDRVAALMAAQELYGAPAMVLDAGTALTYTVLDGKKKILGGGISPGVAARFRAMSDYCGELPPIEYGKYDSTAQKALDTKTPLPVFARDTETAMMSSVFSEIGNQCRSLVKHFLEAVKDTPTSAENENDNTADEKEKAEKEKKKPAIVLTGGDAFFLNRVLNHEQAKYFGVEPGSKLPVDEFQVYTMKYLVHYGIGHLLAKKVESKVEGPDDVLRSGLVGQRVAKYFAAPDEDGEHIYRGSIVHIRTETSIDTDLFFIRYDDGDSEHVEIKDLYDLLSLYCEHGEKPNSANDQNLEFKDQKLSGARKSADLLFETSAKLREEVEKDKQRKEAEAKARANAPEVRVKPTPQNNRKRSLQSTPESGAKKSKTTSAKKDKKTKYINKRVAKAFEQEDEAGNIVTEIFYGTIDQLASTTEPYLWHVQYDDDDEEEFDEKDVKNALKLYAQHGKGDPNPIPESGAGGSAAMEVETAAASSEGGEDPATNESVKPSGAGGAPAP